MAKIEAATVKGSVFYTDEFASYNDVKSHGKHVPINHKETFGAGAAHINGIEVSGASPSGCTATSTGSIRGTFRSTSRSTSSGTTTAATPDDAPLRPPDPSHCPDPYCTWRDIITIRPPS